MLLFFLSLGAKQFSKVNLFSPNDRPFAKEIDLSKPWVTEAVKNEFSKKEELLKKAKESSKPEDWVSYKEQRDKCTTVYEVAKLEYIGQHPEEVRIPQLMLPQQVQPCPVNLAPVDYTADVVL